MFPELDFPPAPLKLRNEGDYTRVWDICRQKWIIVTPEEWVRQHLLHYLMNSKAYPSSLIELESTIKIADRSRRFDLVCRNYFLKPVLLAECKAPGVAITQDVFQQASMYNIALKVPLLLVTNGLQHYICRVDYEKGTYEYLQELPPFSDI